MRPSHHLCSLVPSVPRLSTAITDRPFHSSSSVSPSPEIDECVAYADALRARGIDDRVVVKAVDRDEVEKGARGPEGAVEVTYETLEGTHDHSNRTAECMLERIRELERDNRRLRDMMDVKSHKVT
nr:hypothetical protein [Tanacetum cinerariifolium]